LGTSELPQGNHQLFKLKSETQ